MATNIVLILVDDMGYSDIGPYGSEIPTPNLDRLAAGGVRMSQFYNTARCSPSRASLLTGLHPHQTGIGILTEDQRPYGYPGTLNDRCLTMAEVLGAAGYATYMSGKWHLCGQFYEPHDAWPTRRGFEQFFGTIAGGGSYFYPKTLTRGETSVQEETSAPDFYYTDAISEQAVRYIEAHDEDRPFFLYTAYTAPHWPLHAPEEDIAAMKGLFDGGWDELRRQRAELLVSSGVLDPAWGLSERDPDVAAWDDTPDHEWETQRMEVYAAQLRRMDAGVGRILDALEATGQLEDTLLMFLSDNGGCAEGFQPAYTDELPRLPEFLPGSTRDGRRVFRGNVPESMPGGEETYASYGTGWANLSNTPFREYKHWVHEGGIATPFIVHWPAGGLEAGAVRHDPHQLPDVLATVLEATGVAFPSEYPGRRPQPLEGISMLPTWRGWGAPDGRYLYWEHEGNSAVRRGRWKLVRKHGQPWELYDMATDRTELHDLCAEQPDVVAELVASYEAWARRCGVIPRETILAAGR
ncbi:arylsulfatase [Pseudactinotalea terrae]|uniref:arylsulfatase n=1 Tax=Pseudactinotalea terrae TaxID=1743262 RepID=UPI0012E13DC9|nr:arylsulfatase [Pseudactinotalea terrae]